MRFLPRLVVLILVMVLLAAGPAAAQSQTAGELYFPETGHWLTGEFLTLYQSAADPLVLYGYPITDAFQDPLTGYTVQYFNRARLELHADARPGQRVQLSPLGWLLYEAGPEVAFNTDTAACRYFESARRFVCYSFLDFYNEHGGLEQFGNPVSNLENHDGLYVQYFERARLEWHPELPAGQRVTLADLGQLYFDQRVNDPALLRPNVDSSIQPITRLKARAFVARAVLGPNARQTLYVVVQDQYLRPVEGAGVSVTLKLPNGSQESFNLPATDASGISQHEFLITNQPADSTLQVAAEVTKDGLEGRATTWFRIWW